MQLAICGNAFASIYAFFKRRTKLRLWYTIQPTVATLKILGFIYEIPYSNITCLGLQGIALLYFNYFLEFHKFEVTGSYEVGYKEFRLSNKTETMVGMFYP